MHAQLAPPLAAAHTQASPSSPAAEPAAHDQHQHQHQQHPPPPTQPSSSHHSSFRHELEHGPPLHYFTDPRAEEPVPEHVAIAEQPEVEEVRGGEEATIVGSPTGSSWDAEKAEKTAPESGGEKADVIYVEFDEGDPRNPFNFSARRKWAITWTACSFTILVSWALSCYAIGIPSMREDLGMSVLGANMGVTLYAWGFGIAPMLLAPIAEEFGRNVMYLSSAFVFTLFIIPCAVAKNLETILVARFLLGVAGSTGSTMVGGTLADIWVTAERGLPMSIFASAAILGISLGAMTMGTVADRLGWRIVQWIFFAMMGSFLPVMFLVFKETRAPVILTRLAKQKRRETGDNRYRSRSELERPPMLELVKLSATRPFYFLFTEPVVTAFSLYVGVSWGVLYGILEAMPFVLQRLHGFTTSEVGYAYLTFFIAVVLGFFSNMYQDRLYLRYYSRLGPEARLFGACAAGVVVPVGCFIFGWTSFERIHWIAPCIGLCLTIFGIFQVYLSTFNYLSDAYLVYASSALAAQSFSRNAFAGAFPLFIDSMYERLTPRWAASTFGFIAAFLAIIPFVLIFKGPKIRSASKVAQTLVGLEK